MRLHVILGLSSRKSDCVVTTVYAGHDGLAARQAMANSPSPLHVVLQNPLGVVKNNANSAANATRIAEENKKLTSAAKQAADDVAKLRERVAVLEAENETLRKKK